MTKSEQVKLLKSLKKEIPANNIPVKVRIKAELMAKALFNTKPITNKELRQIDLNDNHYHLGIA